VARALVPPLVPEAGAAIAQALVEEVVGAVLREANDNFSRSMGNAGFGMRGSIARTINGFRGFGATGCPRFRVTGGGRTAAGSVQAEAAVGQQRLGRVLAQ